MPPRKRPAPSEADEPLSSAEEPAVQSDSEDEEAWDEVDVTADNSASALALAAASNKAFDVVISTQAKAKVVAGKKKKKGNGSTLLEQMIRHETHKLHATCLLATGLIRNRWINSQTLRARILSHLPSNIYHSFFSVTKTSHPNDRDRSRLFDKAMKELVSWWFGKWRYTSDKGIERRLVREVEKDLKDNYGWIKPAAKDEAAERDKKGKGRALNYSSRHELIDVSLDRYTLIDIEDGGGDFIRHFGALEKRAIQMEGSKDFSVLLFTCLCRALDVPARLVFSLQPVDWRAPSTVSGAPRKKKGETAAVAGEDENEEVATPKRNAVAGSSKDVSSRNVSGDEAARDYRPKLKSTARKRAKVVDPTRSPSPDPDDAKRPPVFWTEVYSRPNREWIVVDVVRKKMRCRKAMEPDRSCVENQMRYVLAFEEDHTVKDVTKRYAQKYSTVTMKARVPSKHGSDWFAELLVPFSRSFQLNRDHAEDAELEEYGLNESMPTSVIGFKDHPNYVLARHLKQNEVIDPEAVKITELAGIKGAPAEPIFRRAAVLTVKGYENYLRMGRRIKPNEIPLKFVKSRNVTINKKRAAEALAAEGQAPVEQPLYSWAQTELYIADPIVDGVIPRNEFGNIDLYVPTMLPAGGAHITTKGAATCAKKLGIAYADAVTGFEFRQRRAHPILTGVVVASENAPALREAVNEYHKLAEEREAAKRQDRCIKRWKKFILGLRIRSRFAVDQRPETLPGEEKSQIAHRRDVDVKPKLTKKASTSKAASTPAKPLQELPRAGGRSLKFTHKLADDTTTSPDIKPRRLEQDDIVMKTDVGGGGNESDSSIEYMS